MVDGQRLLSLFSHPSPYLSLSLSNCPERKKSTQLKFIAYILPPAPLCLILRFNSLFSLNRGLSPQRLARSHSHNVNAQQIAGFDFGHLFVHAASKHTHTHTHPSPKLLHLPGRSNTPRDSCWLHCFHMCCVEVNAYRLTAFYRHMRKTDTTQRTCNICDICIYVETQTQHRQLKKRHTVEENLNWTQQATGLQIEQRTETQTNGIEIMQILVVCVSSVSLFQYSEISVF